MIRIATAEDAAALTALINDGAKPREPSVLFHRDVKGAFRALS